MKTWGSIRTTRLALAAVLIGLGTGVSLRGENLPLVESHRIVDRSDERVSVLSNGLTVILKTHRTAPVVSAQLYCRTGSVYEQEYLGGGVSHLLEHLLHGSATPTRSEAESREILNALGGNTNAYTSMDVTCYYINSGREHLEQAVNLLADWITHPAFPQDAFDREWAVVQRELERDLDDANRQMFYLMLETMYREHPARYPIIGHQPIVQTLTKEDIVGYYHRTYVPDNMLLCLVGDIDLDETIAVACREFAGFARRRMPTITLPIEPEMVTPRRAEKRMKVNAAMLQLCWPTIPLTHPDLYALDLLSYVLTEGESSRLARTIRDAGLTYTIDSMSWTPAWGPGVFGISARLDPGRIETAVAAIHEQIEELQRTTISPEELEKAKRQKAAEHVFASQTAESIATMMGRDYLATGDAHFSQAYVANIQKVTAEELRSMAVRYLVPQRQATITILPEDSPSTAAEGPAETEATSARKIVLDNGLRCLIRPDPTSPVVAIQMFSFGGILCEDETTNGLSNLAALLAPRGTNTRTAQEIADFFDSRGGTLTGASGNNTLYFRAEVLKEDFGPALEVFADVVGDPTFPEEELRQYRLRVLDAIRRIDEQWRSELFAFFDRHFYGDSPYRFHMFGSEAVIEAASREQIADFYRRWVNGPQSVLAVFGDVQPAEAEALVRKWFADLSAETAPLPTAADQPARTVPELYVKAKSPDRRAAGLQIGFTGMTIDNAADRVVMDVLDTIISGYRFPTGWLHESLRGGDRSFVYEVHAVNRPGVLPGYFGIYAACHPEQVNEVYGIITEQLDKARAGQFTEEELEQAKTMIVTTELMENQTNSNRAMQAALNELYGLGYDYQDRLAERVRAVTMEQVRRIAERYLTVPVVAVVTPEPDRIDIGIKPTVTESD
ncbi:MAG: insulinase family protein [Phycisphaerales bacterium]|nr:insulinase family protein [Phycisphaerales bacterium]